MSERDQQREMESATVISSSSRTVVSVGSLVPHQKRGCSSSSFNVRERDASFSSYLRPVHDVDPTNAHNNSNNGIVPHENLPLPAAISSTRSCTAPLVDDSTEISIFDAQKYFNELSLVDHHPHQKAMIINGGSGNNRVSPVVDNGDEYDQNLPARFSSASSSVDGYSAISRNYRARSFHAAAATPTASSEASWNSQTGLLSAPPGTMAVSVRNPLVSDEYDEKKIGSSTSSFHGMRWLSYRRKCPCSGKKSVQVKEKSPNSKTTTHQTPPPRPAAIADKRDGYMNSFTTVKAGTTTYRPPLIIKPHEFQDVNWGRRQRLDHLHRNSHITLPEANNQVLKRQVQNQSAINGTSAAAATATSGFTFPILDVNGVPPSSSALSASATVKLPVLREGLLATSTMTTLLEENPPRESLEVFRPPSFTVPASPKSRPNNNDEDVASDASSDLFEIESFSTSTQTTTTATTNTYPSMFHFQGHRRDSLDEASTLRRYGVAAMMGAYCQRSLDEPMTPSTEYCYEPSEASIDWSVTTAEGFDRASVTNALEAEHATTSSYAAASTEPERGRRRSSGGSGLLLSCRCEKAVSVVGPQPVRLAAPAPQPAPCGAQGGVVVGPGLSQSGSSTLGTWVVGTAASNKTPLARSHSARMSLPFATS